jgi:hypothetical protein
MNRCGRLIETMQWTCETKKSHHLVTIKRVATLFIVTMTRQVILQILVFPLLQQQLFNQSCVVIQQKAKRLLAWIGRVELILDQDWLNGLEYSEQLIKSLAHLE